MKSAELKKYLSVLLAFLFVASIIFLITLSYSVKVSDYFSSNVQINIVNAGDTEGQNGIYTTALSDFTINKYNAELLRYYSEIELSGKDNISTEVLNLRRISFNIKSAQSGSLTIKIEYYDTLSSYTDQFSLNLAAGQGVSVERPVAMTYRGILSQSKIKISVIAADEGEIANPDNIAFALYNLELRK